MNIFYILYFLGVCKAFEYLEVLKEVSNDGLLHLGNKNWKNWVKNEDYGMFLFITAIDPRLGCALCREFDPTFKSVADSYWGSIQSSPLSDELEDKSKIIFAIAEFNDVKEMFQFYDIRQVPKMLYYAPGKGPQVMTPSGEYQFLVDDTTQNFQRWIVELTPGLNIKRLEIVEKTNGTKVFIILLGLLSILGFGYLKRTTILKIVQSKTIWMGITLCLVLIFISGHMFNEIRKTPSTKRNAKGETIFIMPGQQVQLGVETKIVFVIYTIIITSLISLIKIVPGIKDIKMRMILCILTCLVLTFAYSGLINAFGIKSTSYPFRLFKFM